MVPRPAEPFDNPHECVSVDRANDIVERAQVVLATAFIDPTVVAAPCTSTG